MAKTVIERIVARMYELDPLMLDLEDLFPVHIREYASKLDDQDQVEYLSSFFGCDDMGCDVESWMSCFCDDILPIVMNIRER